MPSWPQKRIVMLHFIAIVPPAPILSEIRQLKEYAAAHFDSRHALRSPAHITLFPPFDIKDRAEAPLALALDQLAAQQLHFTQTLKDFAYFEPRVVFVNVVMNENLQALKDQLVDCLREHGLKNEKFATLPFHPHVTIAFRDLTAPQFKAAEAYFSNQRYEASFTVADICLLRLVAGRWHIVNRSPFLEGPA